jgi:prepilin-type N-terminal cleavage/methylation domain-containing protein
MFSLKVKNFQGRTRRQDPRGFKIVFLKKESYTNLMRKTISGFTLVELMIVIVVIALLATIGIVSYNGVQSRARDTKRIDDVAHIGRGLQLWAGSDKSLSSFGGGSGGQGFGWFENNYGGANIPIKQVLQNNKLITDSVHDPKFVNQSQDYVISICTNPIDNRRVIMAKLENPPTQTVAQQISQAGCTTAQWQGWTTSYGMNYAKVF